MAAINHFSDLLVYRKAFTLGLQVFACTKDWPREEKYALTDQVRRSSRAVGAAIAEAWGKRRYEAHFVAKFTDADAELHETEHWLGCALKHDYLSRERFDQLRIEISEVGRMIGSIMANPTPFLLKDRREARVAVRSGR